MLQRCTNDLCHGDDSYYTLYYSANFHCVKSVCVRSYSGPQFPAFGLNMERYTVSLNTYLWITPNTDIFLRSVFFKLNKTHKLFKSFSVLKFPSLSIPMFLRRIELRNQSNLMLSNLMQYLRKIYAKITVLRRIDLLEAWIFCRNGFCKTSTSSIWTKNILCTIIIENVICNTHTIIEYTKIFHIGVSKGQFLRSLIRCYFSRFISLT